MRNYIPKSIIPERVQRYVTDIIRDYKGLKYEYMQNTNSILLASPSPPDKGSHRRTSNTSDTTGDKVVRLVGMSRLSEELQAFETVYSKLGSEEKKFVQEHFWDGKGYLNCDTYMSVATMKRTRFRIIYDVGIELGMIR